MLSSPARPRALSLRTLAVAAALAVVSVGVGPLAAHAEGELVGGTTRDGALPLVGPVTGGAFRVSNVGITSSGQSAFSGSYQNIAWYSYTPAVNGILALRADGDGAYDITLELLDPSGALLGQSGLDYFEGTYTKAGFSDIPVDAGERYLVGMGGFVPPWDAHVSNGTATLTLTLDPWVPSAPTGVVAVPGPESLAVSWEPPAEPNGALTAYVVWYRTLPDGEWARLPVDPAETSAVLTGLTGGQPYAVRVRARNAAGASDASDRALATPLITPVISLVTNPDPPTNRDDFDVTVAVTRNGAPARGRITVQIGNGPERSFWLGADGVHTYGAAGRRAGSYPVTIVYDGSPDGLVVPMTVSGQIVVAKDVFPLTFELGGPFTYGGSTTLTATTDSGLDVTFDSATPAVCTVSGTTLTFVGAGVDACTVTATQPETAEIAPAAVTDTATVNRAPQAVTIDPLPPLTFGGPGVPVTATAGSGDAVVLAASGDCVLDAGMLVTTGAGSCTVTGDEDGTALYLPAPQATVTVPVAKRAQALSVAGLPTLVQGAATVPVTVTSDVGLPVTLTASGACVVDDGAVRTVATGRCTVTATQVGDDDTLPADGEWGFPVVAGESSLGVRLLGVVGDEPGGLTAMVDGTGLRPGADVSLTVYSAPTQVGLATVRTDGTGLLLGTLPDGLEAGVHRLVARAVTFDGATIERTLAFGVADDGTIAWIGAAPALPRTGATTQDAGLVAALWVLVGSGLVLSRSLLLRRRRTASA